MDWLMCVHHKYMCTMVTKAANKREKNHLSLFQCPNVLAIFRSFVWLLDVVVLEIYLKPVNLSMILALLCSSQTL